MKRTYNIQLKVSSTEKEAIERNAAKAGMTTSKYLRTIGTEEGKVIFLDKGGYIPKNLIEINDKITGVLRNGQISHEKGIEIIDILKRIMTAFVEVTEQLTVIRSDSEEE